MRNYPNLLVVVRNKEKLLFSGKAQAVSSINVKGPFDVLSQHENFISLIKDKVIIHITPTEQQEIKIENGIIRVFNDKIFVYVNFL
jgi:F0F1-type ATP synthase epsilon subunit